MAAAQPLGDRELDIMQALWAAGPATVTDVHARLAADGHDVAYTTVQTMMNRLETKALVSRETSGRAHTYRAVAARDEILGSAVQRLAQRFFGGSAAALATHLVQDDLSDADRDRLRRLLDEKVPR